LIDTKWAGVDLDREVQRRKRKKEKEVDPMIESIKKIDNTTVDLLRRKIGRIITTIKIEKMIRRITMMLNH